MDDINGIIGLLSLVGWAVAVIGVFFAISNASKQQSVRPGVILILFGAFLGFSFAILGASLVILNPQEVGVVFRSVGGDEDSIVNIPLGPGVNWILPFVDEVTIYPTHRQSVTLSDEDTGSLSAITARTNDGQAVTIDITVIYRITPETVNDVYKKWLNGYEEGAVVPFTRAEVRDAISDMNIQEVYSQRELLAPTIIEALGPRLQAEGVVLVDLAVRNIAFGEEFMAAVEAKQIAEQNVERATNEAEAVRKSAEGAADASVTRAKGERDAVIARAEGEAEATLLRAKAEAEALRLINEQLSQNPMLLQWRYIDELGDNVRMVIIPSNSPFLFDIETLMGQTVPMVETSPPDTDE